MASTAAAKAFASGTPKQCPRTRSGFGYWVFGPGGNGFVIFQGFIGQVDGFFELGVVSVDHQIRALLYFVVGVDAMVLDDPLAAVMGGPEAKCRGGDGSAMGQGDARGGSPVAAPVAPAVCGPD